MGNTYLPKAFFISLVVNMENLIGNMMIWENVTEQKLMRWRLRLKKLLDTLTGGATPSCWHTSTRKSRIWTTVVKAALSAEDCKFLY